MKMKKKISMIVLVTFLLTALLPTGAWAVTTSGKSFTDVTDKHWAKQQITRMNYRGVINGYEDGTARPDQSVTEFEAVSMAVRIMGLESQTASVASGAYLPVTVPTWKGAKETAVVAYQNGLIDENDFKHDQAATREWIAKLLVKILKQESMLDSVAGEYLDFGDVSAIGANYLSYVKVAKSLGLIGGYTDGTFKPKNKVTRAEMAAFLSRAEDKMSAIAADNLIIGTVLSVDGINVSITKTDGTTANFYVVPNNSALYSLTGSKIEVSALKVGDPVYVLYNGSMLNYLEVRASAATGVQTPINANLEGTITKIVADKKTIVLTSSDGTLNTLLVSDGTTITRSNTSGTLGFNDLQVGDKVKVASTNQSATQIVIVTDSDSFTQSGTIYDVDVYNKLIIMNESSGLKTYKMADSMTVSIAGMLSATASSLKTGDKASYEIKNQEMVAIAVGGSSDLYDGTGTILEINTNSKFITYKTASGALKANYYNSATKVTFDGENGSISDLQVEDVATISVSNDYITNISVNSRKLNEGYKGTVYAIDYTNSILTIKSSDGSLKTYPVSSTASITLYDSSSYLSAIKKDMAIEIGISNGTITNIKANNRITGKVVRVNTSNKTLEILPESSSTTVVYNVSSSVYVDAFDESSTKLSAVDVGDTVNIKVVNNLVTEIDVTCLIDYTVYTTYSNSSTHLTVKDSNDYKKELYINSNVTLVIPGDSTPTVKEIKEGDKLIATYNGSTLEKVEVSKQIAGTVTSINASAKTVSLRTFGGSSYTYNFDSNSYVDINGYTYSDLSKITVGEKIAVSDSADHGRRFAVLQTRTAKVGTMQATRIFVQNSSPTGDWTSYSLSSDVYLHKGSTVLKTTDFKLDDTVTIYYADGMVYEVVKQ